MRKIDPKTQVENRTWGTQHRSYALFPGHPSARKGLRREHKVRRERSRKGARLRRRPLQEQENPQNRS